jgi:YidC/Oxa1 family membrane protein insertase
LFISDVVLSDWSGAAQEFSLGLLRPAVFVDTPKKTHNSEFSKLDISCYEDVVRKDLGALVRLTDLDLIPELVESLHGDRAIWRKKLERLRNEHLYNPGTAVAAAADYIVRLLS